MHIVHSNIELTEVRVEKPKPAQSEFARQIAYKLYKKACKNNAERIAQIQEYFPGWEPKFNIK